MGTKILRALAPMQLPLALLLAAAVGADAYFALGLPTLAIEAMLFAAAALGVARPSELASDVRDALHRALAERDDTGLALGDALSELEVLRAERDTAPLDVA